MLRVLVLSLLVASVLGHKCVVENSIDVTEGDVHNGKMHYGGFVFNESEYFYNNNTQNLKGCIDLRKFVIPKCCPDGKSYDSDERVCIDGADTFRQTLLVKNYNRMDLLKFRYGKPICGRGKDRTTIRQFSEIFNIGTDGKLYVETPVSIDPWMVFDPDNYCIDTFVTEENGEKISKLDALACFMTTEKVNYIPSITCMLISCVFILVTVAVYIFLPELCNLHGKVLISYLLSIFVGFIFLSTMQILLTIDNISITCCLVFTFIIYYFLLAAFFWLNVMSFDIWWTFSGNRGVLIERMSVQTRFRAYCLYAFGLPTVLTILLAALEFSNLPFHPLLPLLRQLGCFINGTSRLLYLYGPIVILCLANAVFFTLTAIKIRKIKKETSVLKSKESATHDKRNNDKQRLCLYLKLFAVMGINWLLEVISSIYPEANKVWKFTDAYNVLVGLMIFILFVCKRKIFRLLKKRIKETFDRRSTELRSTSQTYASRNNHIDIRQSTHSQAMKTSNGKNTINTTPV